MKRTTLLSLVFLLPPVDLFRLQPKDLPKFKHACAPDNPKREKLCTSKHRYGTAEGFSFGKIGKNNNVYCKVFGICIGLSTGTIFLTAQTLWRQNGILPSKEEHFPYRKIHDIVKTWHNQGTWNPHAHAKQEAAERLKKDEERQQLEAEEKDKKEETDESEKEKTENEEEEEEEDEKYEE